MMKHTLLYIAVSGMTLLTSCQLGKHYTRPDLHLYGHNLAKPDRKDVG